MQTCLQTYLLTYVISNIMQTKLQIYLQKKMFANIIVKKNHQKLLNHTIKFYNSTFFDIRIN